MSDTLLLQPWITLAGPLTTTVIVQPALRYLDLSAYAAVAIYVEVSESIGDVILGFETSPTIDDSMFASIAGPSGTVIPPVGISLLRYPFAPPVPLARFLRWRIPGARGSPWSITFRAFVSANRS